MRDDTRFYREDDTGDYLAIHAGTLRRGAGLEWPAEVHDGRAAAIAGDPSSCQSTTIGAAYLDSQCEEVCRAEVPKRWLRYLDPDE